MIKKISKKILLGVSIITSSALGFLFTGNKDNTTDPYTSILQEPIFSIEKAHADGAGGDCCCSSDGTPFVPPDPISAWVTIDFEAL